jgi:dipeptidyl-peptidase-4
VGSPPSFPRQHASTRGFTLGEPRGFSVAAGGGRVAFLRSLAGDDPVNRLWVLDLDQGERCAATRLVADPAALLGGPETLPPAERARRERVRERAAGIVAYAADRDLTVAAFALGGRLFVADLGGEGRGGSVRELAVAGPVLDPRPDPSGQRVAYVTGGELHVAELCPPAAGPPERLVAAEPVAAGQPPASAVSWGLAEFIAAEEMDRDRGYWWAPDGLRLAVARVDTAAVQRFHLADPANPTIAPVALRYPAAGTANADVCLFVVDLRGARVKVRWDRAAFPYLVQVVWQRQGPLTLLVQSRDQTGTRLLAADPQTGSTSTLAAAHHPAWLEIVAGVPAWLTGQRLVATVDDPTCDTRRLTVDGEPVTPPGLQVLEVLAAQGDQVWLRGSREPSEIHVWRVRAAAATTAASLTQLSHGPGVHTAAAGGATLVLASAGLNHDGSAVSVHRDGRQVASVASAAARPALRPRVTLLRAGEHALRSALLLPAEQRPGPLPVLLDPYGGPHTRRVLAARGGFLIPQWFADQGFAVLVSDGRGTPGRGPAWEHAVYRDLAGPPLEDQVEALHAVAGSHPELALGRVAIRGWSFGGYLAALAVLRRPDVFHAAVAGAPVTDWRLYDTHYTERYLGDPRDDPEPYRRCSLLADAARLERPLLLIHGLADDNVVAAHTLRLSSLLLAAGRAHSVLPLSGVTHMTPQEVVAENLLLLQLAFLRAALGLDPPEG